MLQSLRKRHSLAAGKRGFTLIVMPTALTQLTAAVTNSRNHVAGPFMASVPAGPSGWSAYNYSADTTTGVLTISATGDNSTVRVP